MGHNEFTVMFGGEAGYGVMSAGTMVAKAAGKHGVWSFVANEYPSLIKGGLNTCLVRLADRPLGAYEEELDFLAVLSQPGFEQNQSRVRKGGTILYDADSVQPDLTKMPTGVNLIGVKLIQSLPGDGAKVMANSALVGAFCALAGFSPDWIAAVMKEEFKKPEIQEKNIQLMREAYQRVQTEHGIGNLYQVPESLPKHPRMLLNGNDAISMGAIQGGAKFSAGYPMTPGSSVLVYLADHAERYGLVFKQAEDEIAAMNMLIGAGFAGVRAIGSTSGGGFALMVEALGFAAQAEVPVVMVNAQRGGPSTGLPTRTAQADLSFVNSASQGEFLRVVVAPGDMEECFYETFRVMNLAEKYQIPCIILTDKYLADSSVVTPFFATDALEIQRGKLATEKDLADNQPYQRYKLTDDGVSLRAIPGQAGGRHIATSYTHGEDGFYSSGNKEYAAKEPEVTAEGLDKLFAKEKALLAELPAVQKYGPDAADLTLILWGSTKGPALEALELAKNAGLSVNMIQVRYIAPFPTTEMNRLLAGVKKGMLVEGNKTGQLGLILRAHTGYAPDYQYLKYDSRPYTPTGILTKIKEVLS